MNKNDLIESMARRTGLSRTDCARAVESLVDSIADALKAGQEVKLVGFGTFLVSRRKETRGVNPRTRQPMTIPAANHPRFKPGKSLKDAVN